MYPKVHGFEQHNLIKYNVSNNEALLLRYLQQFFENGAESIVDNFESDNKRYYFIAYKKIMKDLPILEVNTKSGISYMINRLEEKQLVERYKSITYPNKVYLSLNLSKLYEEEKFEPTEFKAGLNSSLRKYIKNIQRPFKTEIGNTFHCLVYKNSHIEMEVLRKINIFDFCAVLRQKLAVLLTDKTYPLFRRISIDKFNDGYIKILFNKDDLDWSIIRFNLYKFEDAIVDTYLDFYTKIKYQEKEEYNNE